MNLGRDMAHLGFGLCAGAVLLVICLVQMPDYFARLEAFEQKESDFEYRYSAMRVQNPQSIPRLSASEYLGQMGPTSWKKRKNIKEAAAESR